MHDTRSNNTVRRVPNLTTAQAVRSNERKGAEVERLRLALVRIQELATDTPDPEDIDAALNAIVRECEDVLSEGAK